MPQMQPKLREIFDYLQVRQRLVLCAFTLLAIINSYTIRLCLDFCLNRIVKDCSRVNPIPLATPPPRKAPSLRRPLPLRPARPVKLPPRSILVKSVAMRPVKPTYPRQRAGRAFEPEPLVFALPRNSTITLSNSSDVWSKEVQVLVTVSFYVGYMITHIPGGRLAERYGGKWILGASILCSAILTLLTPTIVRNGGPHALMLLRLMIGVFEGPTFPAVSAMLAQWVPEKERSLLCSCVLSGGEIGITLIHLVSGLALDEQDWAIAFYVVGSGAVLWFVGFVVVCYSKPDASPYIQSSERDYIKCQVSNTLETSESNCGEAAPWNKILLNAPIWALITANMQHDWNQLEMARELEGLLHELENKGKSFWQELEASIQLTAPHLWSWLASITSGQLSDYLIEKGILNRTETRRLMSWLVFFSLCVYCTCNRESWGRACSIVAFGAYYAGIKLLPLDMSPNFAGTLMGISNGLGALPGLLMPMLEQLEQDYAIVGSIRTALWLICAGYLSGDVQSYNKLQTTPNPL